MRIYSFTTQTQRLLRRLKRGRQRTAQPVRVLERLPQVQTIIDVGVGRGTRDLHSAFPDSYLLLVEPLTESKPYIERILANRSGKWIQVALGAKTGTAEFYVEARDINKSSMHIRTPLTKTGNALGRRTVEVQPLDNVLEEAGITKSYGIKIDTEGHELEVLKGAQKAIRRASFVIAECSILPRFEGSYEFGDMIRFMDDNDYKIGYLLSANSDSSGLIRFVDVCFLPKADTVS